MMVQKGWSALIMKKYLGLLSVSWVSKFGVVVDRRELMIDVRCLLVLYGRRLSELEFKVDDAIRCVRRLSELEFSDDDAMRRATMRCTRLHTELEFNANQERQSSRGGY